MNKYKSIFSKRHTFLPVIHCRDLDQTLENLDIAYNNCDGVFLINHSVSSVELLKIHHESKIRFPDFWMGINLLGEEPEEIFKMLDSKIDGLWVDNAYIDESNDNQYIPEVILNAKKISAWQGLYFGGIAFKYQKQVDDAGKAAAIAMNYMDVVTTSGKGTGIAADIEKIKVMKKAIGNYPLAIASGITLDNIEQYLDFADCFLVATGISKDFETLDAKLVNALSEKINNYKRI
jgi:uncharacterized protein